MAPAIRQPPLLSQSWPATPYQQTVQPPSKTMGLGVRFDSTANKPTPTNSQDTDVHRRFTGWIKPGSYYHGVVASKGQLNQCLHLAGTAPPRGHKSTPVRLRHSHRRRWIALPPVPPCWERKLAWLKSHTLTHPFPWRQEEWVMAAPGWSRLGQTLRKNEGETDPPSGTGHHLEEGTSGLPILSGSRIVKEGTRLYSSSTAMLVSAPQPIMMWLPREWPATTLIWRWALPRASTIWYSVWYLSTSSHSSAKALPTSAQYFRRQQRIYFLPWGSTWRAVISRGPGMRGYKRGPRPSMWLSGFTT